MQNKRQPTSSSSFDPSVTYIISPPFFNSQTTHQTSSSQTLSLITVIKHHQQASLSFLPLCIVPISDVFFFIDKITSFFFFFFHNTNIEPLTTNFTYTSPPKVTRTAFSLHRFTPSHNNSPSLTSKQQLHPTLKLTKPQYKLVSDNLNTLTTTITGNQTSLNHKNPCPNIYSHHLREGMLMLLALLHLSQHLRNPLLNNSLRIQTLTTYCIIVHTQTCTTKQFLVLFITNSSSDNLCSLAVMIHVSVTVSSYFLCVSILCCIYYLLLYKSLICFKSI